MQVILDDPDLRANWLIAYDRHADPLKTHIPKQRRLLMVSEPPEFQNYAKAYLHQFGTIVTPYRIEGFKGCQIVSQSALPWFYGMDIGGGGEQVLRKGWEDLKQPAKPPNERMWELTAICSTKTQTKNQIRRLRFLKILKADLGDRLKIFGRGFEPLSDKAEVIDNSVHHLALENNLLANGWTEKTADAILGEAFPIHAGSPLIEQDFDIDGMMWINLTRPFEAAKKVRKLLDSDYAFSVKARQAMDHNKTRLMQEHNLFPLLHRLTTNLEQDFGNIGYLKEPETIKWHRPSSLSRLGHPPRLIKKMVWQANVAMVERQ